MRRMATMRFAALLACSFALLLLPACDSDGGDDDGALTEVDGSYRAAQMRFVAPGFQTLNLLNSLEGAPSLLISAGDREFFLRYDLPDDDEASLSIQGTVSRSGDQLRFNVARGNAGDLLLPTGDGTDFSLTIEDGGGVLSGSIPRTGVDLREYGIDQSSIDGTLQVRFESSE